MIIVDGHFKPDLTVSRPLKHYLSADGPRKQRFYEAVEGASAACRPVIDPLADDAQIARNTAETALEVVKRRSQRGNDGGDHLTIFITDAYAKVTMAYHRAAGTFTIDQEMQQLGTAAVHLLTIATSYMTAHPPAETHEESQRQALPASSVRIEDLS